MGKNDFSKMMQDMMGAFPTDPKALQDVFRTQAQLGERMCKVYLEAAEKSVEVSTKWTRSTLAKLGEVSTVKEEPADYAKSMTEFASAAAEMAAEHLAAYAEIAKRVQLETVELMLAAGKDLSAEATEVMRKATSDVSAAAKRATDEVTAAAKKASVAAPK